MSDQLKLTCPRGWPWVLFLARGWLLLPSFVVFRWGCSTNLLSCVASLVSRHSGKPGSRGVSHIGLGFPATDCSTPPSRLVQTRPSTGEGDTISREGIADLTPRAEFIGVSRQVPVARRQRPQETVGGRNCKGSRMRR